MTFTQWMNEWRRAIQQPGFRLQILISFIVLIVLLSFFTSFLEWVEQREGVVMSDPVLMLFEARDFTWATFGIIYLAVLLALAYLSNKPHELLLAIQAYALMVIVRTVMMYLAPLNPAEGLIVLQDPLVQYVGNGTAPTKDLFFSGHTSTMFLLALLTRNRRIKGVFLSATVLVAAFVVWQHVHYVIDVAVAPFVAYTCYRMAVLFQERTLLRREF